ncbi:MAG TPA: ThiF family adenylyltransferase [Edaphobacter sp.]|uniref:HesA/MoeB/ThiF family protein n=1 Tax=Edaphobacter sp. TaxID=1934404 RepID=UPI002B56CEAD|nr:ThiF family adenylyltransferase [Edaphobacter sp.]HUZ93462.1 ThiF family adenylyltransferase [Edaphobacter sp.]
MNDDNRLFTRIAPLFDVGLLSEASVLVAGCGSGGSQVALQLAMSGIRNFFLLDKEELEVENVIRHACGLRYVGQDKIDALADVLLDRNPAININGYKEDIMTYVGLAELVKQSTVVILATDNEPTRYLLNQLCVETQTPFVVGKVFTRGIGGEVFSYRPGEGGCLACLERTLERSQYREGIREIDLVSEEEREKLYGMEISEIRDSPGLNVDISFITSFHTRFALDAIARTLPERPKHLPQIQENYVVWGNRPTHPFTKHFQLQRITLAPQEGCLVCGKRETE